MNTNLYKYPRTPHLPFSEGMTSDDKMASRETMNLLQSGIDLVCTEKMDGGNITMYKDAFHSRSLTSGTHAWDTATKAVWAQIHNDIPEGWRISGESMYARRSVSYDNLPGVFMVFGMWNENNELISWDETVMWANLLGIPHVPVLYRGNDYEKAITAWKDNRDAETSEGFVLRDAGSFAYNDFSNHIAKFVRENHVRTRADWRHRSDFAVNTFLNY